MRLIVIAAILSPLIGLIPSCKRSNLNGDERDADAVGVILPQRVTSDEERRATVFEIDEKTGRPKAVLVLRLDYFPSPEPGRTTLPSCFRTFPSDFALGSVICDEGEGADETILFAKHVDQDCYTDASGYRTKATEPLLLAGCLRAVAQPYHFDPPIRIDVEVR